MKHEERAHSPLGASVAHRWIPCSGSVAAQAGLPNPTNEPAAKGTAHHEIADQCLKSGFDADRFIGETIHVEKFSFEIEEAGANAVQVYLNSVRADVDPGDILFAEQSFDLSDVYPGMFGTNDACVYKRKTRHLIVTDYKNGYGIVDVVDNPQLKYYGVGAARLLAKEGLRVDRVTLRIVQPNAPHVHGPVRDWDIDPLDLIDFEIELAAAAERAMAPDAPRIAGEHCEYCLAAGTCPVLRSRAVELAQLDFADRTHELTPETISEILNAAPIIEAHLKGVWALAAKLLEEGWEIPGFKRVARQSRRKWAIEDEQEIIDSLGRKYGLEETEITKRKLLTPTQVAGKLPADRGQRGAVKEEFLDRFSVRETAGYTIARDVDPRAIARGSRAELDFDPIDDPQPNDLLF